MKRETLDQQVLFILVSGRVLVRHYSPTIRHPLCRVVGTAHLVFFDLRELVFNPVTAEEIALI